MIDPVTVANNTIEEYAKELAEGLHGNIGRLRWVAKVFGKIDLSDLTDLEIVKAICRGCEIYIEEDASVALKWSCEVNP